MSKLYIFAIGGTGSRVLRSLIMLLAAGVNCNKVNTIVPIVIDRDNSNGDFTRTKILIDTYIHVRNIVPIKDESKNIENEFFNTEIKLLNDELLLRLDDSTQKFRDFIGLDNQSISNQALCKILFSENTLNMYTHEGFKGNPNIGSVVLNQFDDKDIFKTFAQDFQQGDKIFIISSIFGGTGASGFPLLLKTLQTPRDKEGDELQNWGLVNDAPIGAITVLPYFNVDKKDNIDSDTFNDKSRAALVYYETLDGKLDTLYYIADTTRTMYAYAEGGAEQKNNAHFVELAAALSIIDFVNSDEKIKSNGKRKTTYKEFGIYSDVNEISFDNLARKTQELIVNPLSRFMLFTKYMGYVIDGKNAVRKSDYDIFEKENKYQPYSIGRFDGDFRKNKLGDLDSFQKQFLEWLHEMSQQERKFIPFNLSTKEAFNFVNGRVKILTKEHPTYKGWALVDNELNKQITKVNKSLVDEKKFIELFYRVTKKLINQENPIAGNSDSRYIFRLQNDISCGLSFTIEHWGESIRYGKIQQNAIQSSNKNSMTQPTSIPSPFARIALVKTAFAEVAEHGENALLAYQKIVSDCLDVAEIFFTFDKWKDKVDIITWKYGRKDNGTELQDDSDLKMLENKSKQLYKTLKLFLESDALKYNFDRLNCIYILKYKNTGDMIGATSPCTLFFSSANDYSQLDIKLNSQRKAFEGIVPLHKRNWEFQKYLYSWIAQYNENRDIDGKSISMFEEFLKYLEAQKKLTNRIQEIDELKGIKADLYEEFESPKVEVLAKPIHKIKKIPSDLLTADDILENVIIRIPYKINRDSFFDGNLPEDIQHSFLLPIKEKFFDTFKVEDLKNLIKINEIGKVIEIEIKVENQEIISKKYYYSKDEIIDLYFDCALFPNVKFNDESLASYRFGIVYDFKEKDNIKAEFKKIGGSIDSKNIRDSVRNETHSNNRQLKNYSLEGTNFDYITITYKKEISGIIIPNFKNLNDEKKFIFAVDFGTTNTHIEFKEEKENKSKEFEISKDDSQVAYLHGGDEFLKKYFDEEYIPAYTNEEFKFPMRTALSYGEKTNWSNVYPFEKASLNELYEKRLDFPYNKTETDLKWSDQADYQNKVKVYIESIMYMIRNKVILNGGNLRDTKIIWFYPISMERRRYENLVQVWNNAYRKYFGGNDSNIVSINESIAPFLYYIKDGDKSNLVTIDIGGGTTDVVIAIKREAKYITSFRFAANAIFGDGYSENYRIKNGIVSQFCEQIKEDLLSVIKNQNDDIFNIFNDMLNKKSEDIASFLFSLEYNPRLRSLYPTLAKTANLHNKLLNDNTQTITFIFFYSSIIYHIAKLMKALKVPMPKKIVFSGYGSRVIDYVTTNNSILSDYTALIFQKIYNHKNNKLEIIKHENPKAITCKGGFYRNDPSYRYEDILSKIVVLHSDGTDRIINQKNNESSDTYKSVDENYLSKTVEEVENFIDFVLNNLDFFKSKGYKLNSKSIEIAKNISKMNLYEYAEMGLNLRKKEVDVNELINESMFFYPLVGMLKELTVEIYNNYKENNL